MSKNQNPFSELFSSFANQNPFADSLNKSFNFDKTVEAGRTNAQAFSEAAKTVGEAVQSIARLQSEIVQKNAEDFSTLFKNISASKSVEETTKQNAEYANKVIESTLKNTNEVVDIANQSGKQASEIIGKRVSDAINELAEDANEISAKSSPSTKKKAA